MPSNLDLAAFIESALHITSEVPRDRILQVLLLHIADEFTDAFTRHGGTVFHRYDLNHKVAGSNNPGQYTLALALDGCSIMGATVHTLIFLLGRGWNTNGLAYLLEKRWCRSNIIEPNAAEQIALELAPHNPRLRFPTQHCCGKWI